MKTSQIKVIKRAEIKPAPAFIPQAARVTAAQTVKNWIAEHKTGKEIQRQRDFQVLFGTN